MTTPLSARHATFLALALVIGLAGGLAPAAHAARMRPIEALRRA